MSTHHGGLRQAGGVRRRHVIRWSGAMDGPLLFIDWRRPETFLPQCDKCRRQAGSPQPTHSPTGSREGLATVVYLPPTTSPLPSNLLLGEDSHRCRQGPRLYNWQSDGIQDVSGTSLGQLAASKHPLSKCPLSTCTLMTAMRAVGWQDVTWFPWQCEGRSYDG